MNLIESEGAGLKANRKKVLACTKHVKKRGNSLKVNGKKSMPMKMEVIDQISENANRYHRSN